jgi:hypothetical protein
MRGVLGGIAPSSCAIPLSDPWLSKSMVQTRSSGVDPDANCKLAKRNGEQDQHTCVGQDENLLSGNLEGIEWEIL